MYAAEWPCCHDPLRFSLGSDDLSPQRGNPTRRTPNACLSRSPILLARLALLPRALPSWGVAANTERTHAAARAWREGLCVSRTRPHALCVPRLSFRAPFTFHFLNPFGRAPPSLISDEFPGNAMRVCASRARPRTGSVRHAHGLAPARALRSNTPSTPLAPIHKLHLVEGFWGAPTGQTTPPPTPYLFFQ